MKQFKQGIALGAAFCAFSATESFAQNFTSDVTIQGSLCVGFDCTTSEAFGFDTIRMKENNVRIKAQDTSSSASFPSVDWQLTFNDSSNGGLNKFSVEDTTNARIPFTIEASAPNNSVYVDDAGNMGLGTSSPIVQAHMVGGNTPALRIEQNGSSGFGAQTWDIAGNETNFFVRDVSNGSKLPFKIFPNAPTNALIVEGSTGDLGIGIQSPTAAVHLRRSNGLAQMLVEEVSSTADPRTLLALRNNGSSNVELEDTSVAATDNSGRIWKIKNTSGKFLLTTTGTDRDKEFEVDQDGNLAISGNFISGTTTLSVPDYVFADDYVLRPLHDVRTFIEANSHLPEVPSAKDIDAQGLNMSEMQMILLKKVEELTLYTLDQEDRIATLTEELQTLRAE